MSSKAVRIACTKHLADLRRNGRPLTSIGLVEHVPVILRPKTEWRNACPMEIDDREERERRACYLAYNREMMRRKRAALRAQNVGA